MKRILLVICCLYAYSSYAQNTLRPNIYFNNMHYYNVASGIIDSSVNAKLSYYAKSKVVNNTDPNRPMTTMLSFIGRSAKMSSQYSASYIYDSYSYYDRHTFYGGYTYQWNFNNRHYLSAGARAVLNFDEIKWDKLQVQDNRTGTGMHFTPDLDLGVDYRISKFNVGLAYKNLLANSAQYDGVELLKNQREFYMNMSYSFLIKKKWTIAPSLLYYHERDSEIDMGLHFAYKKMVSASYTLRLTELRSIYTATAHVYKGLNMWLGVDHSALYSDKNVDVMLIYLF